MIGRIMAGTCLVVAVGLVLIAIPSPSDAQVQEVRVVNPVNRPVPIFDVDASRRYQCSRFAHLPPGAGPLNLACDAVPAGMRLTLEFVSVKLVPSSGNTAWRGIGVGPEVPPVNSIHLVPQRVLIATAENWLVASQAITFYVEPGAAPSLRSDRANGAAEAVYELTLQGRLIPIR